VTGAETTVSTAPTRPGASGRRFGAFRTTWSRTSAASDIGAALQGQFVFASRANRSAAAVERVRSHDSSRLPSFPPALLFVAGLILSSSIALTLRVRSRSR
jgi:hypothetical protein